jgi:hypothetical protein
MKDALEKRMYKILIEQQEKGVDLEKRQKECAEVPMRNRGAFKSLLSTITN